MSIIAISYPELSNLLAPELSLEYRFDPHITIGCMEDKNLCLEIIEELNKKEYCIIGRDKQY